MKSVLMSIQPKWCELIANGKKTVEVRKTAPKIATPFKVYIYCTKAKMPIWDNGHIVMYEDDLAITNRWGQGKRVENPCGAMMEGELFLNGKVIGEFVCDCIANYEAELWDDETFERIQEFYEPDDFAEYGEYEYKTIADNSDDFWKENMLCKASCLTIEDLRKYLGTGITEFYGWHISNLVIYDKPRELSEFYVVVENEDCGKCKYYDTPCESEPCNQCQGGRKYLTRPPQSWMYCESEVDAE